MMLRRWLLGRGLLRGRILGEYGGRQHGQRQSTYDYATHPISSLVEHSKRRHFTVRLYRWASFGTNWRSDEHLEHLVGKEHTLP